MHEIPSSLVLVLQEMTFISDGLFDRDCPSRRLTDIMIFNVTQIEFDFTDDEEGDVPLDCQQETIDDCLGPWEADDEDDLIEEIHMCAGWCIKSIDYHRISK